MSCIAAMEVELGESPIGTRSRASEILHGTPVATRTMRQVCAARRISHLFVVCAADEVEACGRLIPPQCADRITVRPRRIEANPFRRLVRAARKWSLDGWRGGIGGVCSLDEYTRSDELALLAQEASADALLCVPSSAPLIDHAMIDAMIEHSEQTVDESRLTFAQAPPGLVGTVYRTELLLEMGSQHMPPGMVLSYKPDHPQMDLAHKACCYTAPESVRHAGGRLIVDTDRAFQNVHDFLATGAPIDAERVGQWLIERNRQASPVLPREVEIELTTADPLPETVLRPRGNRVGRRGPIDVAVVERIAEELSAFDDSLVVLGGFGDPLLHPEFTRILEVLHSAGVYGVAVQTTGLEMSGEHVDAMIAHGVDVVGVQLDARSAEVYRKVHGRGGLDDAVANIDRLMATRTERKSVTPLLVPDITKSVDTLDELDSFFDHWVRETGWANLTGYSHRAGQCEDRSVMTMAPPARRACRRINDRALVLANGDCVLCDQDFRSLHPAGNLAETSLQDFWQGAAMTRARCRHRDGHFDATPLCAKCDEWHRP